VHGFGEAAQAYFGKDLRQLTLPEAALLAGLPQSPSRYSPFRNSELVAEVEKQNPLTDLERLAEFDAAREGTDTPPATLALSSAGVTEDAVTDALDRVRGSARVTSQDPEAVSNVDSPAIADRH
jgi:membrane peptidoglycan carboxypeptidase